MPGRKRDDTLVAQLAVGKSVEDAALAAGVSRATAFRRLAEDAFQRRVTEARGEFLKQVAGQLADGARKATETLLNLLQSGNERIRLVAARSVIEQAMKAHDLTVLEGRVEELEKIVRRQRSGRP
jgi:hypothetical protein